MREQSQPINWENNFAWVKVFRAFRIALDIRKILLGSIGILLLMLGDWFISGEVIFSERNLETPLSRILKPLDSFLDPLGDIILQPKNWPQTVTAWTNLFLSIFVWSFFGLAISRMAAVQFARNEKIGLRASLKFSFEKYLAAVSAPIIPICGIGLFWFLGTLGGWIGNIPGVGEIILGALWILPLCFGFAGTLILIGLCLGWPLMVSAIGTEGSDGFDGFSRSFSYIYSKFWHYAWYVFVTLLYGFITISLFYIFVNGCSYLSTRMVSTGMEMNPSDRQFSFLYLVLQSDFSNSTIQPIHGELGNAMIQNIANIWLKVISLLCAGMAVSFFWTGTTIVYFLIRRADDATDFNEVYHPVEEVEDDLLPLVGIADSEQPTTTRPVDGVQNPDPPMEVDDKPSDDEPDQNDEE
jgi:hypothetical protein